LTFALKLTSYTLFNSLLLTSYNLEFFMPTAPNKLEFLSLQRKQLDAKLSGLKSFPVNPPRTGWIRTIRTALGMKTAQLGRRLGMTQQGVTDLEKREAAGTITLESLRKAADALGCDVVIAVVPRTSLEEKVQHQAKLKAAEEGKRLVHTMRLEAQEDGVEEALDIDKGAQAWLTTRIGRLWD
jgi:predicted DNA-binding mobile mystery protein A